MDFFVYLFIIFAKESFVYGLIFLVACVVISFLIANRSGGNGRKAAKWALVLTIAGELIFLVVVTIIGLSQMN